MAAGLGFKDFTTGEVLTAADVDGYLMQGIWVFADSAARDAAVTSPQEGNFAFLKDTNTTTYYTGSAWTNLDTTGMVNPMTTTGDTIYSSSGSTPARLGIGSTGQVLTVAGGVPTWATVSSGGMTLINAGGTSLSGGSVSVSSIPTTYKHLYIVAKDITTSTASIDIILRFNSDTGSNYAYSAIRNNGGTVQARSSSANDGFYDLVLTPVSGTVKQQAQLEIFVPLYTETDTTAIHYQSYGHTGSSISNYAGSGIYDGTAAITTVSLIAQSTYTFSGGKLFVYGVS